jgi:hypothetical protein
LALLNNTLDSFSESADFLGGAPLKSKFTLKSSNAKLTALAHSALKYTALKYINFYNYTISCVAIV